MSTASDVNDPLLDTMKIHGVDGMGDVGDIEPRFTEDMLELVRAEHAALAMIEMSKKYDDLTVLATGPLTNLALAVKLDPGLPKRLKNLVVMGGK